MLWLIKCLSQNKGNNRTIIPCGAVDFGLYKERRSRGAHGSNLGASASGPVVLLVLVLLALAGAAAPLVHSSFHSEQNHLERRKN